MNSYLGGLLAEAFPLGQQLLVELPRTAFGVWGLGFGVGGLGLEIWGF